MRSYSSLKGGFLIPRIALAMGLFMAATYLAFYSFAGALSPSGANAQPPFPVVENKVTSGGLTFWPKFQSRARGPGGTFPLVLTYQPTERRSQRQHHRTLTALAFSAIDSAALTRQWHLRLALVYTLPVVAPNAAGQIVIERARSL